MGTRTFAFTKSVLILQVVSGVLSFHEGPQLRKWNDDDDNDMAYFLQGRNPMFGGAEIIPRNYNLLDDAYESQLPPPPTMKDMPEDTIFRDRMFANDIRGTLEDATSIHRNDLSGAGHLKTNEILKTPNALPKTVSLSNSNDNKNGDTGSTKTKKEQAPVASKSYNHPELDKAVKNAIDNLPSSGESPLVPLIKIFNAKVQQESKDKNEDSEREAAKRFLDKHIILKLAKRVQSEKDVADNRKGNQNVQESQKEDNSVQVKNPNENGEDDQPCDCDGECDEEEPQRQAESGVSSSSDRANQPEKKDQQTNTPVIFILRKPTSEETQRRGIQARPWTPLFFPPSQDQPSQLFKPLENSPLLHLILRVTTSKSISTNTQPSSSFEKNKSVLPVSERMSSGMDNEGCGHGGEKDESSQESNQASSSKFTPVNDVSESSDENKRSSYTRIGSPDQSMNNYLFPGRNGIRYHQEVPKELILLKHFIEIMKAKAAANALSVGGERQLPQFVPLPSFSESSNAPTLPISRLVLIRRNPLSESQLPPKYFPDDNSEYKIKKVGIHQPFPINRKLRQGESDSKGTPRHPVQLLGDDQEVDNSDAFAQQTNYHSPQEIPFFIRNIIANHIRKAMEGRLRPTPTTFFAPFPEDY